MLLAFYIELGRETVDLDFLLQHAKGELGSISTIIKEIVRINLNDGFTFKLAGIEEVDHLQTPYPGFAIGLVAQCGGTKTKIFLDIGIGDVVTFKEL